MNQSKSGCKKQQLNLDEGPEMEPGVTWTRAAQVAQLVPAVVD